MPVKILYLDHAPYEGGAEVSLKQLLSQLNRETFEAVVISPEEAPYLQGLKQDIRIIPFTYSWEGYKRVVPLFRDLQRIFKIIRKEYPAIIHTNTRVTNILGGLLYTMKLFDKSLFPVKFINHVRDKDPLPIWKFKLIGSADRLIANSNEVKNFLTRNGISESKIEVIYNGVDLNNLSPKKYAKHQNQDPVLLFIGQLYPRKGVNFLIESLSEVKKEFPEVRLKIVGQDPTEDKQYESEYLALAEKMGVSDNVEWLGYLDYETQIPTVLAQTDVFILPSLEEPFGRVIVDAMAMEVPVVASRVGGIPEIVVDGETGFLVEPHNSMVLAQRILELLRDRERCVRFGKAGRKRVEGHFSLELNVKRIETLYDNLLDRR